jgi:hypothetical protein
MEQPYGYEIRVEGHLTAHWANWFDGLSIRTDPNGETILTGVLTDQSALFGVLRKIHDLNLTLVSVRRQSP